MIWIFLVLLYGLLKGGREIAKKKAMEKNTVMEVLLTYTLISFVLVLPSAKNAGGMETKFFFYIAIKSFAMFLAWICSFYSLKKLPVSLFGVISLSRVLFATFFGVVFLHEVLNLWQILGMIIVCTGLLLLKVQPENLFKKPDPNKAETQKTSAIIVILAFASCFLNAISGFLDKVLMKDITSSQLQFWYMIFIVAYYLLYVLFTRTKISKSVIKNGWVWLLAIMFVIGDKALFVANGMAASRITVMTLIKQSSCIVTIIGGRIFFKEKNILYRIFCAAVVIVGILFGIIGQ